MKPVEYCARPAGLKKGQKGVALAIALILLVVMTLLGISTVRTVTQQEKMSSNSHERSLAYQYAEAALREGEQQAKIQAQTANAAFPADQYLMDGICTQASTNKCVNGLCSTPDPDCDPRWQVTQPNTPFNDANWTSYGGLAAIFSQAGNALIGVAGVSQPKYFIEILRPVKTTPCTVSLSFDHDCNQVHPAPDSTSTAPCMHSPAIVGFQACDYYRYRVTARVQMTGGSTVMLQSVFSVQP